MITLRKLISYLFLSVYSVILIHNFVPHTHHCDQIDNFCTNETGIGSSFGLQIVNVVQHQSEHSNDLEVHCHLGVESLTGKFNFLLNDLTFYDTSSFYKLFQCENNKKVYPGTDDFIAQLDILQPYGLRAPPASS